MVFNSTSNQLTKHDSTPVACCKRPKKSSSLTTSTDNTKAETNASLLGHSLLPNVPGHFELTGTSEQVKSLRDFSVLAEDAYGPRSEHTTDLYTHQAPETNLQHNRHYNNDIYLAIASTNSIHTISRHDEHVLYLFACKASEPTTSS